MQFFCWYLSMDAGVENSIGKGHRNILMEFFRRCFYLYLPMYVFGSLTFPFKTVLLTVDSIHELIFSLR